VWLAYDAKIRKRHLSEDLDPSIFQQAIWHKFYIENMPNCIVGVMRLMQAQYKLVSSRQVLSSSSMLRSPTQQSGRQSRVSYRRGQPYQDHTRHSFCICIVCRNDNHKSFSCFAKKLVSGGELFLHRSSNGFWGDADGRHICFAFNSARRRECRASPCPQGDHKCSLCGNMNHGAQCCSVLAFAN
jgi:hypothetical protein